MAVEICCGLTSAKIAVAIAADFRGNCCVSEGSRGNGRGWPWKLLWFDVRGNCRGNCRGLPWVAMVGTTEFATDRTAARAVATTVACAVEAP